MHILDKTSENIQLMFKSFEINDYKIEPESYLNPGHIAGIFYYNDLIKGG
jgi:hypothetical protein